MSNTATHKQAQNDLRLYISSYNVHFEGRLHIIEDEAERIVYMKLNSPSPELDARCGQLTNLIREAGYVPKINLQRVFNSDVFHMELTEEYQNY
jgi:hypothetical protein